MGTARAGNPAGEPRSTAADGRRCGAPPGGYRGRRCGIRPVRSDRARHVNDRRRSADLTEARPLVELPCTMILMLDSAPGRRGKLLPPDQLPSRLASRQFERPGSGPTIKPSSSEGSTDSGPSFVPLMSMRRTRRSGCSPGLRSRRRPPLPLRCLRPAHLGTCAFRSAFPWPRPRRPSSRREVVRRNNHAYRGRCVSSIN
jgi:hypothetical protein